MELLKKVRELLDEKGFVIENIDSTIIAQRPKLASYRPQMAANIADALHLDASRGEREGHYRGGAWLYGKWRGDFRSGDCPVDGDGRLLL